MPPHPASNTHRSGHPTGSESPAGDPGDPRRPFIRQIGKVHPLKPRTPQEIAAFANIWRSPLQTLDQIARRYRCGRRTIQKWRVEFGLGPRDQLMRLQAQGATVATAAGQVASEMHDAAAVMAEIARAQAVLGIRLGLKDSTETEAETPGRGGMGPSANSGPDGDRQWDPLRDQEIASLLEEIRADARRITQHSDLAALQRRLAKLAILVSTKMPGYTWESLQMIVDSLSRTVLWARKVEAEIPQGKADPVLLRQEAGRMMMRELREVLSPEDQAVLATIVKRGADAIMARKGRMSDPGRPLS